MSKIAEVDIEEIIKCGTIISSNGQRAYIYPFDDSFRIELKFVLDDSEAPKISYATENNEFVITLRRNINDAASSALRSGFSIAEDDQYNYSIRMAYQLIGSTEQYTAVSHFNVTRSARQS